MSIFIIAEIGINHIGRTNEGWYEDLDGNKQWQWNYLRKT